MKHDSHVLTTWLYLNELFMYSRKSYSELEKERELKHNCYISLLSR